jgi:uncharacterized small protein (DUF1192 family)
MVYYKQLTKKGPIMKSIKSVDAMSLVEVAELNAQLAAVRAHILKAQQDNTNRDEKALEIEREWYRQNRGKK